MRIEYVHASRFGNGAAVAEELRSRMAAEGVDVDVRHVRTVKPSRLPPADLYVLSSPGRFGKPTRGMRRFLARLELPAGTRYAIVTTEMAPKPDRSTGLVPTEEQLVAMGQRVRPVMTGILEAKGLVKVAEAKVYVTGLKGPLEEGWREKVAALSASLASDAAQAPGA